MFYLPMALFVPPSIFCIHNYLNILYQFWIHTEVITSLGPLEYILNTPSHHRVSLKSNLRDEVEGSHFRYSREKLLY